MICKNCENDFKGNFCNNCGQKKNVHKVNLNYLINEISNSFFQVNRGLFFTIKELSFRPGKSIRNYLYGKRKQHYKPLAFVLLTSTVYVLLTHLIDDNTYIGYAISGMLESINNNDIENSELQNGLSWLSKNFAYTSLLLLPIFSFASYLIFLKSKYNYFEHLILNIYVTGQQTIIYLIFSLFFFTFKIENYYVLSLPLIISISYLFWAYIKFFNSRKVLLTILLTIFSYIIYSFLLLLPLIYFFINNQNK